MAKKTIKAKQAWVKKKANFTPEKFNPEITKVITQPSISDQLCFKITNPTKQSQLVKLLRQTGERNQHILIENFNMPDFPKEESYEFTLKELVSRAYEFDSIYIQCKNNKQFKKMITIYHRRAIGQTYIVPLDISKRKKRKFIFEIQRNGTLNFGSEYSFELLPNTEIIISFCRYYKAKN